MKYTHSYRCTFNSYNIQKLEKRDAIGIWNTPEIEIKANTDAKFLIMEIPMEQ